MKNFIHKVQALGRKAGELRAVVQSAPGKAAEIRQALTMTAGEFQQLRADVQSNVHGLRATNEDHLLQAMREINDRTYALEEAGYELTGLELDLTSSQRLAVHLRKFDDVPESTLRSLMAKETVASVKSILAGLINAERTAANVELTHLKFAGLVIHIGAIPLVRISWSSDTLQEEVQPSVGPVSSPVPVPPSPVASPSTLGSFFEPRPAPVRVNVVAPVTEVKKEESLQAAPVVPQASVVPESQPKKADERPSPWSKEALDRFKKMPNLSKHRA